MKHPVLLLIRISFTKLLLEISLLCEYIGSRYIYCPLMKSEKTLFMVYLQMLSVVQTVGVQHQIMALLLLDDSQILSLHFPRESGEYHPIFQSL
jgi:hypothetical protein